MSLTGTTQRMAQTGPWEHALSRRFLRHQWPYQRLPPFLLLIGVLPAMSHSSPPGRMATSTILTMVSKTTSTELMQPMETWARFMPQNPSLTALRSYGTSPRLGSITPQSTPSMETRLPLRCRLFLMTLSQEQPGAPITPEPFRCSSMWVTLRMISGIGLPLPVQMKASRWT